MDLSRGSVVVGPMVVRMALKPFHGGCHEICEGIDYYNDFPASSVDVLQHGMRVLYTLWGLRAVSDKEKPWMLVEGAIS